MKNIRCPGSRRQPRVIDLDRRGQRGFCAHCGRNYRRDHLGRLTSHQP